MPEHIPFPSDSTIILYPRSYNKRGEERLHSVQGLTPEGEEINVKLRVDDSMLGKDSTPSIAEFSREDIKAKNLCLSSPSNSAEKREGVLLFTGCVPDGENRKGLPTYIARWAYVLAAHSEAPDPIIGLGRIVMSEDSPALRHIRQEIEALEEKKEIGWEALSHAKKKEMNDPTLLSFFAHIYEQDKQATFHLKDKSDIEAFARSSFDRLTGQGAVGGVLIRFVDSEGKVLSGRSHEIFPKWQKSSGYQSAEAALGWFFRTQTAGLPGDTELIILPILRYAAGPAFKRYYFSRNPEDSMAKMRKFFMVNDAPTVSPVVFTLSRRDDVNEFFLAKYYPLTGIPCALDLFATEHLSLKEEKKSPPESDINHELIIRTGLSTLSAIAFPVWFSPHSQVLETKEDKEVIEEPSESAPIEDLINLDDLSEEESLSDPSVDIVSEEKQPAEIDAEVIESDETSDQAEAWEIKDISNDETLHQEDPVERVGDEELEQNMLELDDLSLLDDQGADAVAESIPPSGIPSDIAKILNDIEGNQDAPSPSQNPESSVEEIPESDASEDEAHSDEIPHNTADNIEKEKEDSPEEKSESETDQEKAVSNPMARFMRKKGLLNKP